MPVKDYRHDEEKRLHIPPAGLTPQGKLDKAPKVTYAYDPHLPPKLRFDPDGKADQLPELLQEAARRPLTPEELQTIAAALRNHQPWLEWTTKLEKRKFSVDPIALQIHERISAQAILEAVKKKEKQFSLFAEPEFEYQRAIKFYQHPMDWANRLILGDSLQVMASLAHREALAGKVQMIYFDPPYGIKFASNFQPEVGKRDVKDRSEDLTREPEQVKAYRDTWQLGIHSYLAYLRDRFWLCKTLLKDEGSLFVQIGDENVHRVRMILDEIFQPDNCVAIITVKKTAGLGKGEMPLITDFVLWYAKDISKINKQTIFESKSEDDSAYNLYEKDSGERVNRSMVDFEAGGKIMRYQIALAAGRTPSCVFPLPAFGKTFDPTAGRSWSSNPEGMDRLLKAERLGQAGNTINYVRYMDDFPVNPVSNLWADTASGSGMDKIYVVQTNVKVIERCLLMTTSPGDLVLDPTCGSGTTAYVAEQWGRRWMTIDTSRVAIAIARQRLLTAKYDYYKLMDESRPPSERNLFKYKTVPHITLKSIAQNVALDPIFARHQPLLDAALARCNEALAAVPAEVRTKLKEKIALKMKQAGKRSVTDADLRRWQLPPSEGGQGGWEHWQVPFDTDEIYPANLADAVTAYRLAWRSKMDEVNSIIEKNAETESLVDQPEKNNSIVRVSGPFTVEGVIPQEINLDDDSGEEFPSFGGTERRQGLTKSDESSNAASFQDTMLSYLRKEGVDFLDNKRMKFSQLDPVEANFIHFEGAWSSEKARGAGSPSGAGGGDDAERRVAVSMGPQHGPVTSWQVENALHEASRRGYEELVIAGFTFDAAAQEIIADDPNPRVNIHQAHIRMDVTMGDLLKSTGSGQIFTVFGSPRAELRRLPVGEFQVVMKGVDIFDPVRNVVMGEDEDKVAAWFLDTDYDGRTFCITQAFFPDEKAWEKLRKALKADIDEALFRQLSGTISLPFSAGKYQKAAIKVIDPRGNQVMMVLKLG